MRLPSTAVLVLVLLQESVGGGATHHNAGGRLGARGAGGLGGIGVPHKALARRSLQDEGQGIRVVNKWATWGLPRRLQIWRCRFEIAAARARAARSAWSHFFNLTSKGFRVRRERCTGWARAWHACAPGWWRTSHCLGFRTANPGTPSLLPRSGEGTAAERREAAEGASETAAERGISRSQDRIAEAAAACAPARQERA